MNAARAARVSKKVISPPTRPEFNRRPRLGNEPQPMSKKAFHGIAGEFVRLVEPHTEACREALLVQFLAAAGCVIGRGPHYVADGSEHHPAVYCVVVGDTSKARKGTSLNHVRKLFDRVDPDFMTDNQVSGLSSGEGFIYRVRDAVEAVGERPADPGVDDKRLLVIEDELARPLTVASRQGNTLSTFIRSAWDGATLQTMTRSNSLRATGHHIVIIAHVTREELVRVLSKTDVGNGLANRFLWVHSKRSKLLPDGGGNYDVELLVHRQREAIALARQIGRVQLDEAARAIWHKVYPTLSDAHPGDFGRVTSRSEAQVMRLGLIYALLDGSEFILPEHLQAALAVWQYAESSAAYIFGALKTDPATRKVLDALHGAPLGLTRTDISKALGHHTPASDIEQLLRYLEKHGLVYCRKVPTDGRPQEVWALVCEESEKSERSN